MKTLFLIVALSAGCVGINTVEVCAVGQCATGYYNKEGDVVTAAHAFVDGSVAEVRGLGGYTDRGRVVTRGNDTAKVVVNQKFRHDFCYTTAADGDAVTVSTQYGPVRTRVKAAAPNGYILTATLRPGDSGAPVTRQGCIVGFIHGLAADGGTVALKRTK